MMTVFGYSVENSCNCFFQFWVWSLWMMQWNGPCWDKGMVRSICMRSMECCLA